MEGGCLFLTKSLTRLRASRWTSPTSASTPSNKWATKIFKKSCTISYYFSLNRRLILVDNWKKTTKIQEEEENHHILQNGFAAPQHMVRPFRWGLSLHLGMMAIELVNQEHSFWYHIYQHQLRDQTNFWSKSQEILKRVKVELMVRNEEKCFSLVVKVGFLGHIFRDKAEAFTHFQTFS